MDGSSCRDVILYGRHDFDAEPDASNDHNASEADNVKVENDAAANAAGDVEPRPSMDGDIDALFSAPEDGIMSAEDPNRIANNGERGGIEGVQNDASQIIPEEAVAVHLANAVAEPSMAVPAPAAVVADADEPLFVDARDNAPMDALDISPNELAADAHVNGEAAIIQEIPAPSYPWSNAEDMSPDMGIKVLEEAVDDAIASGQRLVEILRVAGNTHGRVKIPAWIRDFEAICDERKKFQVHVGVSGVTGAGKTTIINALLDYDELLPSGSDGASTGSLCVVHQNTDARATHRFRAVVKFKTVKQVQKWIEPILDDLRALHAHADESDGEREDEYEEYDEYRDDDEAYDDDDEAEYRPDDEEDSGGNDGNNSINGEQDGGRHRRGERAVRIIDESGLREKIEPITAAFGYDEDDLLDLAIDDLLCADRNPVVRCLGTSKQISDGDQDNFADKVKPYLDCTELPGYTTAKDTPVKAWPLVEKVDLYVVSPLLDNGVVLADLPGLGDAMEERARIARECFEKLDITIIVSQAMRAADEAVCAQLLSDNEAVRMRLNDRLSRRTFCVVTSKTDDLKWETYLKKTVQPAPESDLGRHCAVYTMLQAGVKRAKNGLAQAKTAVAEAAAECQLLEHANDDVAGLWEAKAMLTSKNKEVIELEIKQRAFEKAIDYYKGLLTFQATRARDEKTATKIQDTFRRKTAGLRGQGARHHRQRGRPAGSGGNNNAGAARGAAAPGGAGGDGNAGNAGVPRNGNENNDDGTVDVLPVSANAYWKLNNQDETAIPHLGFPEDNYTGIPALRMWIRRATIPARRRHAKMLLHRLHVLLHLIKTGFDEAHRGLQTVDNHEQVLNEILGHYHSILIENLNFCTDELIAKVELCNPLQQLSPETGKRQQFRPPCRAGVLAAVRTWKYRNPPLHGPGAGGGANNAEVNLHWCTHGAIIRRQGGPYVSGGQHRARYEWMRGMSSIVLAEVVERWKDAFHRRLPREAEAAEFRIQEAWARSLTKIRQLLPVFFPNQHAYLAEQLVAIMAIRDYVVNGAQRAMFELAKKAEEVHPMVDHVLAEGWCSTYRDAAVMHGPGVFARRQAALERHAAAKTTPLIKKAIRSMEGRIQANIEEFRASLRAVWDDGLDKIRSQMAAMMQAINESEAGNHHQPGGHDAYVHAVNACVIKWEGDWKAPDAFTQMSAERGLDARTAIPGDYIPEPEDLNIESLVPEPDEAGDQNAAGASPKRKRAGRRNNAGNGAPRAAPRKRRRAQPEQDE